MHCDGIIHSNEAITIQNIALQIGFNLNATKRVLKLMENQKTQ